MVVATGPCIRRIGRLSLVCLLVCMSPACAKRKPEHGRAITPVRATIFQDAKASDRNEMVNAIAVAFREKNPKLSTVGVLELRSWDFLGPRVVIGWAIVGDKVFRGDFKDEMFGVFVVDESLTRVERVVDVFPTPRWIDNPCECLNEFRNAHYRSSEARGHRNEAIHMDLR